MMISFLFCLLVLVLIISKLPGMPYLPITKDGQNFFMSRFYNMTGGRSTLATDLVDYTKDENSSNIEYTEESLTKVTTIETPGSGSVHLTVDEKMEWNPLTNTGAPSTSTHSVNILSGKIRNITGFLTIGLCTVPRENANYFYDTLNSLFDKMAVEERSHVTIVVYLGSMDQEWINETFARIKQSFSEAMSTGLLHIISPKKEIYPDFKKITKRNFQDSIQRVHWRTKQNIDFTHLFIYCRSLSKYYIHLEDDIIAANGYIKDIRSFVRNSNTQDWFSLEFSRLGFIGRLYRGDDLLQLAQFLYTYKDDAPCDILANLFNTIKGQTKHYYSPYSLFQHMGKVSSLANKTQLLTDQKFKDQSTLNKPALKKQNSLDKLTLKGKTIGNPPANISSNMVPYSNTKPEDIYKNLKVFWALDLKKGQHFTIIFDKPVNLSKVVIETGHTQRPDDILQEGALEVGVSDSTTKCSHVKTVADFKKGMVNVDIDRQAFPLGLSCIIIKVLADQEKWLVMSNIELIA